MAKFINADQVRTEGYMFIEDYLGHYIDLQKGAGNFRVRYQKDRDMGEFSDEPESVSEKYFDSLAQAREFCSNREKTKTRLKKKALGLKVCTETVDAEITGVHAGNGNLLFKPAKVEWRTSTYNTLSGMALYPDHPQVKVRIAQLRALTVKQAQIDRDRIALRKELQTCAIRYDFSRHYGEKNVTKEYATRLHEAEKLGRPELR